MNLLEAIESGKKFKRPHHESFGTLFMGAGIMFETEIEYTRHGEIGIGLCRQTFSVEDLKAIDWKVEEIK